jgi:hypothetical protein
MSSQSITSITSALLILSTYITKAGTNLDYTIKQPQTIFLHTITTWPTPTPTNTYDHTITPAYHQLLALFYLHLLSSLVSGTDAFLQNAWWVVWVSKRVLVNMVLLERREGEEVRILKELMGEQRRVVRSWEGLVLELEGLGVDKEEEIGVWWR